jgi:hypothetical protein
VKRIMAVLVVVGGLLGATLGVSALAQGAGESSVESTAPENSRADGDNVQFTAPGDADAAKATTTKHARKHSTKRHSQRVRHAAETSGETSGENSESSVESEAGQPGEPANGHADGPGQNSNCQGNCVQ